MLPSVQVRAGEAHVLKKRERARERESKLVCRIERVEGKLSYHSLPQITGISFARTATAVHVPQDGGNQKRN